MNHIINLWERVIERRLRLQSNILENQFKFLNRSAIVVVYIFRQLMERYKQIYV